MEYKTDFGLYNDDRTSIPDEVLERLTYKWIKAVEEENLWTGGGIREYTKADLITDKLSYFCG